MKNRFEAICYGILFGLAAWGVVNLAPVVVRAGVSCSVPNTFSNGTTADATQVNANFSALVACFANAAAAGANSDITSLSALTTPLTAGQGGTQSFWGGTAAGVNTVTITTVTPSSGFLLAAGVRVCWIPGATNTGAVTINVNGTGATTLNRMVQLATGIGLGTLVGGELRITSNVRCATFGGSAFVLEGEIDYVGEIKDFGYAGCPAGWQEPTGGNVVAANFPDINNAYGTTWGVSGGNVVMPDLRGRTTFSRDGTGTRLTTDQSGALAGNTVGTTGGLQNQTLTLAQLPVFTQIPTLSGTVTPTVTANYTPGNVALNSTNVVQWNGTGSFRVADTFATGGVNAAPSVTGGSGNIFQAIAPNTSIPAYNPTLNAISGASFTVSAVTFGSGNSHPVTPPLGIVTKCVKL